MNHLRNALLVLLSLLCGVITGGLFLREMSHAGLDGGFFPGKSDEKWAVLSFEEGEDELLIGEALSRGGFESFFSESNQEIAIDDFGRLKYVPLTEFSEAVEPFDPRNGGYDEKLRSLFVRDGKRFFFVPFEGKSSFGNYEKALRLALSDFSFEIEIPGKQRKFFFDFAAAGAALVFIFIFCGNKRKVFPFFPLFLCFAAAGPAGLVLSGLLAGLCGLLGGFLDGLFPRRAYDSFKRRLLTYRLHVFLSAAFVFLFCLSAFLGNVPYLPAGIGLFLFFLLEFALFKAERKKESRAVRFEPVWMLPGQAEIPPFRFPMLPFAAAAFALLLQSVLYPGLSFSGGGISFVMDDFVSPDDYREHMDFQLGFSKKPLGYDGGSYMSYYLADDGLIGGTLPAHFPESLNGADPESGAVPPFPLERLRDYLVQYGMGGGGEPFAQTVWIQVVLLLIISIPVRYPLWNGYGGKKNAAFFRDRRAAA